MTQQPDPQPLPLRAPTPPIEAITNDRVARAVLHIAGVGECFARRAEGSRDVDAEQLLVAIVTAAESHMEAVEQKVREQATVAIAERVAAIYKDVRQGRRLALDTYLSRLEEAFSTVDWAVPRKRLERLRLTSSQIAEEKGPKDAAMLMVGTLLDVAQRAAYLAQKRAFDLPAFGRMAGDLGLVRYVLRGRGWSAVGPDNEERLKGWMEKEVRSILTLLGASEERVAEVLERRRALRRPRSPGDP